MLLCRTSLISSHVSVGHMFMFCVENGGETNRGGVGDGDGGRGVGSAGGGAQGDCPAGHSPLRSTQPLCHFKVPRGVHADRAAHVCVLFWNPM